MRVRLTLRGLMGVVALAGLCMAAFRLHFSLGCFLSCVFCMALIRTSEAIDGRRVKGTSGVIRTFSVSLMLASTILVIARAPSFFCIIPVFNMVRNHETPQFGPRQMVGIAISSLVAIPIVVSLRRRLW